LANSSLVRHLRRSKSSTCMRDQNDSMRAFQASPDPLACGCLSRVSVHALRASLTGRTC
jgi:hypothetical protein